MGYQPAYAQEQAAARRWKGSRLERNAELRDLVLERLGRSWSPEQIAGCRTIALPMCARSSRRSTRLLNRDSAM